MLAGSNKTTPAGFLTTGLAGTFNELTCTLHCREHSQGHTSQTRRSLLARGLNAPWDTRAEVQA